MSVLRNGQWARIDGEASEVHLSNSCRIISGKGRTSVGSGAAFPLFSFWVCMNSREIMKW